MLVEGEGVDVVILCIVVVYLINMLVGEVGGSVLVFEFVEGIMIFGVVFNVK